MTDLKRFIRDVPDFPKPGIMFRDITPLLAHGSAWQQTVNHMADQYRGRVDVVLGIESRGFLLGAAVAYTLGCGVAVVRKPGKLPAATFNASYALEYGTDTLEIHQDAFTPGSRVLVIDDLLATGGTAEAAIALTRQLRGEVVAAAFIIELTFLNGRQRLVPCDVFSLVQYDSE
ncbi:MAG: adenine phosphoribosyltransferase [Candidatus Binatia bacterium]